MVAGAQEDLDAFQIKLDEIFKFFNRYGKLTKEQLEDILNRADQTQHEVGEFQDDVLVYGTGGRLVKAKTPIRQ